MELVHQNLGSIAEADVSIADGALVASIKLPFVNLLDQLAAKVKGFIPGGVDDLVVDAVVSAMKAELAK